VFDILDIVLPVFVLIGLGYGTAIARILSLDAGDALAKFVHTIAVPILLARTMATAEFSDASPWLLWLSYFCGVGLVWTCAALVTIHLFQRGRRAAVIAGVSAGYSNLVLLGIPLVLQAYGEAGMLILFLLIAVHLPVMMAASTFLMEFGLRRDGIEASPVRFAAIGRTLARNLATNPIIIGLLTGLVWRFTGLPFTGLIDIVSGKLGQVAGPLALFALGMSLNKYGIKGNLGPAMVLSALSLVALPVAVYGFGALVFGLPPLWLKVAVLAAALPSGVNAYLFASHFKIAEGLASNTIVIATTGAIVSVPLWLHVLELL
jgi:predicted permease